MELNILCVQGLVKMLVKCKTKLMHDAFGSHTKTWTQIQNQNHLIPASTVARVKCKHDFN